MRKSLLRGLSRHVIARVKAVYMEIDAVSQTNSPSKTSHNKRGYDKEQQK